MTSLLIVRRSDTWRTVVPKKAAAVAERNVNKYPMKGCFSMNLRKLLNSTNYLLSSAKYFKVI